MLVSEMIRELQKAQETIGDVGVYVFGGDTLSLKVEIIEEADMIVIRNKTKEELLLENLNGNR